MPPHPQIITRRTRGMVFFPTGLLQMAAETRICLQDGCRMEVMQIFPCTYNPVTFSSAPLSSPEPDPVASHHRHPPRAPRKPQPGCSHGNSRIRCGPVSAVSVSSVFLLALFSFSSVRPSQQASGCYVATNFSLEQPACLFVLFPSFYIDAQG